MRIEGQSAIVTGGASGLGLATGRLLAGEGARVALLDRDGGRVRGAASEIGALGLETDVGDPTSAETALTEAARQHGAPRILVNCAGIAPAKRIVGRAGAMPLEDFEAVVRVNLIGSFNLMRLAAAAMAALEPGEDGERGVIVNTASIAAFEGQIGQSAYAASKGGVAALTLPAARELADLGIRVVAIAPGLFGTPMVSGLPDGVQQSLAASVPFPARLGQPEEFGALVLHILSNAMLNGCVLRLDGALRMAPR